MALFREVAVEKKEKKVNIDRLGNRNGIGEKPGPGNGCHAINAPPPHHSHCNESSSDTRKIMSLK